MMVKCVNPICFAKIKTPVAQAQKKIDLAEMTTIVQDLKGVRIPSSERMASESVCPNGIDKTL